VAKKPDGKKKGKVKKEDPKGKNGKKKK